jgi:uncharacterized protein (TIGR03067 family)
MNRLIAACFIVASFRSPTLAQTADPPRDADRVQGTWQVLKVIDDGEEATAKELKGAQVTVSKNRIRFNVPGMSFRTEAKFTLDPSREPKHFDLRDGDTTYQGIYRVEGDTLTIAMHMVLSRSTRPSEFKSVAGSDIQVWALKRAPK